MKQNLQKKETPKLDDFKFRIYLIQYLDLVVRGLISFFAIGVLLYIVMVGYMKVNFIWVLPVAFILSILISPFLSRVKLGERILIGYENFLFRQKQKLTKIWSEK